jgi:hypothetical protein
MIGGDFDDCSVFCSGSPSSVNHQVWQKLEGKSLLSIDHSLIHLEPAIKVTGWRRNASPVAFSQQPSDGPDKSRRIRATISEICAGPIPGGPASAR